MQFPPYPNSADTNNLELVQTPQAKASVLQDCPLPTSDANYTSQAVTCPSDWPVINWGFLQTPVLGLVICKQLTELNFTFYYLFIIKVTPQEQPNERHT